MKKIVLSFSLLLLFASPIFGQAPKAAGIIAEGIIKGPKVPYIPKPKPIIPPSFGPKPIPTIPPSFGPKPIPTRPTLIDPNHKPKVKPHPKTRRGNSSFEKNKKQKTNAYQKNNLLYTEIAPLTHLLPEKYIIELPYIQYHALKPLIEKNYSRLLYNLRPIAGPKVEYLDYDKVKLTLPLKDTTDVINKICNEIESEPDGRCPTSTKEELEWIKLLISRYKTNHYLIKKDIVTYAPNISFVSKGSRPFIIHIPSTLYIDAPPIVFSTDYKSGGGAALVKLLCSIQTKDIPHGDIYVVLFSNPLEELEKAIVGNEEAISVLILDWKDTYLTLTVPSDITLNYYSETPIEILKVERMCELIIEESISKYKHLRAGVIPVVPSLLNYSEADSLMERVMNYMAANNNTTFKKKIKDDLIKVQSYNEFRILENGDFLIHCSSGNCGNVPSIIFLTHIGQNTCTLEHPEEHLDLILKKFRIIKSDGAGCLGLDSRMGAALGMELMSWLDADTTLFRDYYILISKSNNKVETDLNTIITDDKDNTVLVFNDGLHHIINDSTLSFTSYSFNTLIKKINTPDECIHLMKNYRELKNIFKKIKDSSE